MNFELDEQQRDFAASIDAALGAADVPAAVRAWAHGDTGPGRKVWATLADLGVTALAVPEKFDGIEAHPVDLVVAAERLGRWGVPGPVTESIAVAPILLADDDRSAALGVRRTDRHRRDAPARAARRRRRLRRADSARRRRRGARRQRRRSARVRRPRRKLFDVTATGDARKADTARAFEFGVLATAAQLVGAGQAMLDASVEYAKQRSQFGRVIGSYQAIKHKLADVHIAVELARPLVYGAALSLADGSRDTARDVSAAQGRGGRRRAAVGPLVAADPRRHRLHPGARPVTVAAAGTGAAVGVGRPDVAPPPGTGGLLMSEERELLRDTVAALVEKHASPAAVRGAMESERGYDESLWKLLCEQVGAAALVVPEELGGAGGELADAAVVLEELGQGAGADAAARHDARRARAACRRRARRRRTREAGRRATSIGAVVFDPGYVVNGDVADVVVAADGETLTRWTTFTANPVATMDLTRRLARLEPKDTVDHRRRPRARRHRGDPAGRRADRRRRDDAST